MNWPVDKICFIVVLALLFFYLVTASQWGGSGMVNVDGPRVVFEAGYSFLRWLGSKL